MNEVLQSGEIDIAGPIIQDLYTQEQFQVILTDEIFDITPVVIYKGNEYFKSPKVELIISSSTDIKCKEWGLNRLYNSVAHSLGYNTNNSS